MLLNLILRMQNIGDSLDEPRAVGITTELLEMSEQEKRIQQINMWKRDVVYNPKQRWIGRKSS